MTAVRGQNHSLGEGGALRFQPADKWRLVMATAVTVLALPFLLDQSKRATPGLAVAPAGGNGALSDQLPRSAAETDPSIAENQSIVTLGPGNSTTSQRIVIAVPTSPPEGSKFAKGRAGYRTWQLTANGRPCLFSGAPVNTVVSITNLDNGRTTTCLVAGAQDPNSGLVILLDSTVLQDVADLVEAPVPVRVAWNA